jgi:hypothetical protein
MLVKTSRKGRLRFFGLVFGGALGGAVKRSNMCKLHVTIINACSSTDLLSDFFCAALIASFAASIAARAFPFERFFF